MEGHRLQTTGEDEPEDGGVRVVVQMQDTQTSGETADTGGSVGERLTHTYESRRENLGGDGRRYEAIVLWEQLRVWRMRKGSL